MRGVVTGIGPRVRLNAGQPLAWTIHEGLGVGLRHVTACGRLREQPAAARPRPNTYPLAVGRAAIAWRFARQVGLDRRSQ